MIICCFSKTEHPALSRDVKYVCQFLNNCFPGRWIGKRESIKLITSVPVLTLLDLFLRYYTKSKVYVNRPKNLQKLKDKLLQLFAMYKMIAQDTK